MFILFSNSAGWPANWNMALNNSPKMTENKGSIKPLINAKIEPKTILGISEGSWPSILPIGISITVFLSSLSSLVSASSISLSSSSFF